MNIPVDFHPNLDLEKALAEFEKDQSPQGREQFFRKLKNARLLTPCRGKIDNVLIMNTREGDAFLPAFTSQEEMMRQDCPAPNAAAVRLDDLKHILTDSRQKLMGIAINPFGKALLLTEKNLAEIDYFTEGMTLNRVDHNKPLLLTRLKEYPKGLPKAMLQFFRRHNEVRKVWLLSAQVNIGFPSYLLFLIDFDGDNKDLFPAVAKAVQPYLSPGTSFELLKADPQNMAEAASKSLPIYTKDS